MKGMSVLRTLGMRLARRREGHQVGKHTAKVMIICQYDLKELATTGIIKRKTNILSAVFTATQNRATALLFALNMHHWKEKWKPGFNIDDFSCFAVFACVRIVVSVRADVAWLRLSLITDIARRRMETLSLCISNPYLIYFVGKQGSMFPWRPCWRQFDRLYRISAITLHLPRNLHQKIGISEHFDRQRCQRDKRLFIAQMIL